MAPDGPPGSVPVQARLHLRRSGEPSTDAPTDGPSEAPPALLDLGALEARALEELGEGVYDYYAGGAETETTLGEATAAWRRWRLRPRVLRGDSAVRLGTSLLGSDVGTP